MKNANIATNVENTNVAINVGPLRGRVVVGDIFYKRWASPRQDKQQLSVHYIYGIVCLGEAQYL